MSLDDRVVAILDRVDALCRHLGVPGYPAAAPEPPEKAAERFKEYLEAQRAAREEAEALMARERARQGKSDAVDDDDRERLEGSWML